MPDSRLCPVLVLLSGLALPGVAAAQSACVPDAPADGSVVVCSGTGTGIVDDSLDDLMITVEVGAVITGTDQGFEFDDGVTFINRGSVTGENDHGVQGDNDVTVINYGDITGLDGDGVNIDNDGYLVNYGTISGTDDGVQLEENAYVVNTETGVILAVDEGVNINTDNATLINEGLIEAGDDGVNAAENAYIVNNGTIRSVGGDQDGIDLDSGTIINNGTILAVGSEDGIDFDAGLNDSLIVNTGLVEGAIAINTDPTDTASQTVINTGRLVGRGGTALNLGQGDDVLRIGYGSIIEGLIEMGDGMDTVSVDVVQAGRLTFGSLPEVLDYVGPGLLVGSTLALIDPMPLSAGDHLARNAGFGAADAVHDRQSMDETFAGVFGQGSEIAADGMLQGFESRTGGIVAGQGFGMASGFVALTRGQAEMADGAHELEQTALIFGLSHARSTGTHGRLSALAYLGLTETQLSSPAYRSGDAEMDGVLFGASLRYRDGFGGTGTQPLVDMSAQLDLVHHRTDGYTLSGLGGRVASHGATGYGLHLDIGLPRAVGAGVLRPYLFGDLRGGSQEAMTFAMGGASTAFDAADVFGDSRYGLGVSFGMETGAGAVFAGLEYATNSDEERALAAQLSFRVAF